MNRPNFARIVLTLCDTYTEVEIAKLCNVHQSTINRIKLKKIADPGYVVGSRLIDLLERVK